jgi:uncharacterized protein (DUF302 family)
LTAGFDHGLSAVKKGIVQVQSQHSFDDTFKHLEGAVLSRGLTIFARIDFSGDAEKVGLKMRPTRMLIFGNPKAGTPLMLASPSIAIDFPLKVLVSEDEKGRTWVSYNSPEYLRNRHNVPASLLKNIEGIVGIVDSVAR